MNADRQAFIMRVKTLGAGVQDALRDNALILGWSGTHALIDKDPSIGDVRKHILAAYKNYEGKARSLGSATGTVYRFLVEMNIGDLVIVPNGPAFHIARVEGEPYDEPSAENVDGRIRRPVSWLTSNPIPRNHARSRLVSRMRSRQTLTRANDIIEDILYAFESHQEGRKPTFSGDLHQKLVDDTKRELAKGRMDERAFEHLIKDTLRKLGGLDVRVIDRRSDVGVDVIATFITAGLFETRVGVQAKYFKPKPPVGGVVVDKLAAGMREEGIDLGIVATSGTISEEAEARAEYWSDQGLRIEFMDGEALASLIVEQGVPTPKAEL